VNPAGVELASAFERLDDPGSADQVFGRLAEKLVFRGQACTRRVQSTGDPGTSSAAARHAFLAGCGALARWDLASADSALERAVRHDTAYALALYWRAQIAAWRGAPPQALESMASATLAQRERLAPRERVLAESLRYLARVENPAACERYQDLIGQDSLDFVAWYGLGECLSTDSMVVQTEPDRWSFRSGLHQAFHAYRQAFLIDPGACFVFGREAFAALRAKLYTQTGRLRRGYSVDQPRRTFLAYPAWVADTLAFFPYPEQDLRNQLPHTVPRTSEQAARSQREFFREVASLWARSFPGRTEALEALAVGLEMRADPAAIDTLQRARAFARDSADRFRLAVEEVWLRIKFGGPDDLEQWRRARALADTILDVAVPPGQAELWASLAALTGRPSAFANFARMTNWYADLTPELALDGRSLAAYAAVGAPRDSLRVLEGRIETRIQRAYPAQEADSLRSYVMLRSAWLAYPVWRFKLARDVLDPTLVLLEAAARGDSARVLDLIERISRGRQYRGPAEATLDAVYTEAWALQAVHLTSRAAAWLDRSLAALPYSSPLMLRDPILAASLIRAIRLRSELAEELGDSMTVRRWKAAVDVLSAEPGGMPGT
jgi:hypothetical protein